MDDDPLLIKSLRDTLETDGHIITAATGGQAGIDAFAAAQQRGQPFAVVISDLGMPNVDGRKVASAIKGKSPTTADHPLDRLGPAVGDGRGTSPRTSTSS